MKYDTQNDLTRTLPTYAVI